MSPPPDHPGPVELIQYVRGGVAPGHAAAILAHCVVCDGCNAELGRLIRSQARRPVGSGGVPDGELILLRAGTVEGSAG